MDDFFDDDERFWRFGWGKPKKVKGGIRAQTKKFGNQWWAIKWLEAIEKFGPSRRVARGRAYARKGQVIDLKMEPGLISAMVQGSRDEPYEIEIPLTRLAEDVEKEILHELRTQPIYAATLLAGEAPADVERLFAKQGVPLFPTKAEGRRAYCSCPDSGNPCKHIAAVYYLISLELERDPFLLLHLRGIRKDQLTPQKQRTLFAYREEEPLPPNPHQFWKSPRVKEIAVEPVQISQTISKTVILKRLGSFPFWRGESDFLTTLEMIYEAAREYASRKGEKL